MEQDDVRALIERIDATDFGPEESELVRRALALVSRGEDRELEYLVRLRAMLSSSHHARFEEFIEHFAYCLELHRSDPHRFPEKDGGISVRSHQSAAIASLLHRTSVPLDAVRAVLADYEDYLTQVGRPPRKAWELRIELALAVGDPAAARELRDRVRLLDRPEGRWCAGCEVLSASLIEEDDGTLDTLLAAVDELGEDDPNCGNSRLGLAALAPLAMAAGGEGERALNLHRYGVRESRRAGAGHTHELARHAAFASLASHPERAVMLAGVAMEKDVPAGLSEVRRFETLSHLWLALAAASDAGHGAAPVRGVNAWVPGAHDASVESAAQGLWDLCTELGAELDRHFGSTVSAQRLARLAALRPQRFEVPWAEAAADLAPSGAPPAAPSPAPPVTDGGTARDAGADPGAPASGGETPAGQRVTPAAPSTDQEWLDAVALPALMGDAERAAAVIEDAIAAIADPATRLELYSEAIDVLPEGSPRWYAERAELFDAVGMLDHARLESDLRDLMVADRDAEAGDAPRWREALTWLTTDAARAEVLTHLAHALQAGDNAAEAAEAAQQAAELALALPSRGDALWVLGEAATALSAVGRHDEALALSDRAADLALVGERNALVWRHQRGLLLSEASRDDEAVDLLRQAADIAIRHDLTPVAVHLLLQAGGRAYYLDNNIQAAAYLRLARDLARRSDDARTGLLTMRLAAALEDAGEADEAATLLTDLLEWVQRAPDDERLAGVRAGGVQRFLGDALASAQDQAGAIEAWRGCLSLDRAGIEAALREGGEVDVETASDAFNSAIGVARLTVGDVDAAETADLADFASRAAPHGLHASACSLGELEDTVAQVLSRIEAHAEAEEHARRARELALEAEAPEQAADALDTLARVLLVQDRTQEAVALLEESASEATQAGAPFAAAASLLLAANVLQDSPRALETLRRAWRLAQNGPQRLASAVGEALAEALEGAGKDEQAAAVRGKIE